MGLLEIGLNALATIVITYITYEIKKINMKIESAVSKEEVKELIKDKTELLSQRHVDIKEDLCRLEDKIDKLLEKLIK